jgi:hypothetical protein
VRETGTGQRLERMISDLDALVHAYQEGIVRERD